MQHYTLEKLAICFHQQSIAIRGSQVLKIQQQARLLLRLGECRILLSAYESPSFHTSDLALKRALAVKRELIAFGLRPGQIKVLVLGEYTGQQQNDGEVITSFFCSSQGQIGPEFTACFVP